MGNENKVVRPLRKRPRYKLNLLIAIFVLIILVTGIGFWATQNYLWRLPATPSSSLPRALIMDELALNYPDPSFVTNATSALTSGGYAVSYSGPGSKPVELFRQLASQPYSLIIIRAHQGGGQAIITSAPYSSSQYQTEQLAGTLAAAEVDGGQLYFAITPKFVTEEMQGRFSGTNIIVMGCAALQGSHDLAINFLEKGANLFVGWDGSVTIIHTDISTVNLARQLSNGRSFPDAVRIAGTADPVYGARLEYLDWPTLVQSRVDSLVSQLILWSSVATILILGPLSVFAVPKLFNLIEEAREKASRKSGKEQEPKRERTDVT